MSQRQPRTGSLRVEIHVRPGASSACVGGTHDGCLLVRVTEPADRGRATTAAVGAVAEALGLPRRAVTLVHGRTSRRKVIDIGVTASEAAALGATIDRLRAVDASMPPGVQPVIRADRAARPPAARTAAES